MPLHDAGRRWSKPPVTPCPCLRRHRPNNCSASCPSSTPRQRIVAGTGKRTSLAASASRVQGSLCGCDASSVDTTRRFKRESWGTQFCIRMSWAQHKPSWTGTALWTCACWRVVSHAPMCRMTQELSVAEVHSSRRRPGGGCRATASRPRYVCSAQCLIMQAPYFATYTWQGVVPTSGCPPWGVCPSRCTSECHGPMCSCSTWWWASVEAPEGHATRAVVRYACPLAAVEAIKSLEGGYSVRGRGVVMSAFAGSHRLCCSNLISG